MNYHENCILLEYHRAVIERKKLDMYVRIYNYFDVHNVREDDVLLTWAVKRKYTIYLYSFIMEEIASQESKFKLLTRHFISPEAMDVH